MTISDLPEVPSARTRIPKSRRKDGVKGVPSTSGLIGVSGTDSVVPGRTVGVPTPGVKVPPLPDGLVKEGLLDRGTL